ncbi:DUF4149 domain-containing protein [Vibrio ishigakensis]|nr:DUF4149 domain-containing protein [Vibrio ishigakensis]
MSALYRHITIIYVLLLTGVIGASLFAGAVVAPVIFNSKLALGSVELSRFQEGLIMTENFVRLSYPLALVCLFSFIFELHRYFKVQTDWIALISMSLMVATGLMFSFYFVPEIVYLQAQGPEVTQSPMFSSIHKTSEISFKITAISGLILAYRNLMKLKG